MNIRLTVDQKIEYNKFYGNKILTKSIEDNFLVLELKYSLIHDNIVRKNFKNITLRINKNSKFINSFFLKNIKIMKKQIIPCIILARKNSKGLKSKNIKKLNNLSLIEHSILYAKKSRLISHIIISTDDIKVYKISKKYGCFTIFPRPKKYSQDGSRSEPAIRHALDLFAKAKGKIDIYAFLQVTEPLRPKYILDRCIQNLIKNKKIDSSFAGYIMHKNFWALRKGIFKKLNFSKIDHKPRQNRESIFRGLWYCFSIKIQIN